MGNKKFLGISFIVTAVLSVALAISCFLMATGRRENFERYGGDAYTGIQNAAATTANNIQYLNENITTIAGFAFVIIAVVLADLGIYNLLTVKQIENERYLRLREEEERKFEEARAKLLNKNTVTSNTDAAVNNYVSQNEYNPQQQPKVYDIWKSPDKNTNKVTENVEEIRTERQKLKDNIASLIIKRNLVSTSEVEERQKLTEEINKLKAKLKAMSNE